MPWRNDLLSSNIFVCLFLQALYLLCNLACHGERVCEHLLQEGCFQQVIPVLKTSDTELLSLALAFCEMIIRLTQTVSANSLFMKWHVDLMRTVVNLIYFLIQ